MQLTRLLAPFRAPLYKRRLILGDSAGAPLWKYERWLQVAAELERLLSMVCAQPSMCTRQLEEATQREIRFGEMTWNTKCFQKWCHDSPITKGVSDQWRFVDAEVFWPGRGECIKRCMLPTVYVQVQKKINVEDDRARYDQECHFVIRDSFWRKNAEAIDTCLRNVGVVAGIMLELSTQTRVSSLNQFESLLHDFYYIGMDQEALPNPSKMKARWGVVGGGLGFEAGGVNS